MRISIDISNIRPDSDDYVLDLIDGLSEQGIECETDGDNFFNVDELIVTFDQPTRELLSRLHNDLRCPARQTWRDDLDGPMEPNCIGNLSIQPAACVGLLGPCWRPRSTGQTPVPTLAAAG